MDTINNSPNVRQKKTHDSSSRAQLWAEVLGARQNDGWPAIRHAERVFLGHTVSNSNSATEQTAQLLKGDEYEGLSPLHATEKFCELVVDAIKASSHETNILGSLGENNLRALNQIWRARQDCDMQRCNYDDFATELVRVAINGARFKGFVRAIDISNAMKTSFSEIASRCRASKPW